MLAQILTKCYTKKVVTTNTDQDFGTSIVVY